MKLFTTLFATVLTTVLLSSSVRAGALLSELIIPGSSLTVGDKVFTAWSASSAGDPVNFADINIAGDASDPFNPGLIYTINNGALTAETDDFFDLSINFTVSTLGGQPWITGTSLSLTGTSVGSNTNGLISIQEDPLGDPKVEIDTLLGTSDTFDDSVLGTAVSSLSLSVNILVFNDDPTGDPIALTEFRENFAQSAVPGNVIPEPTTCAVWSLLGLVGCGFLRHRNRASGVV